MKQKHPCPDCRQCQWCSDSRCALCLKEGKCQHHLSIAEQIQKYERLNKVTHPELPLTLEDAPPRNRKKKD